jgi:hypothetical protein
MLTHQLARASAAEPLGSGFVGLDLRHGKPSQTE